MEIKKLSLAELQRPSVESFSSMDKMPVVVVLDNVRSALNVGSFFRTCDAFALEKLVLAGITATPPNREINKTAIGSTESVKWEYFNTTLEAVLKYKNQGYKIIGIEQTTQSVPLDAYTIQDNKIVLIFGNEVNGLDEYLLPYLDVCLEIPQYGTKHSLNVAVCGGIVLWEFAKKLNNSSKI
ncbi:MAG: RNA methyltransferase [Saprospiraceae bacterium]|nr:RNA methyltransferase [Saprospiraceae bacterium]